MALLGNLDRRQDALVLYAPGDVQPCAVVPLGWPRGRYGTTTRPPVGQVVHVDRYGNQPFRAG